MPVEDDGTRKATHRKKANPMKMIGQGTSGAPMKTAMARLPG